MMGSFRKKMPDTYKYTYIVVMLFLLAISAVQRICHFFGNVVSLT